MKIPDHVPWRATGRTLGGGGQGQVHLVSRRDDAEGSKFALKELRNTASLQARQRFQREIEAVRTLDHPSIVKVHDHSEADDAYQYYVMEYHDGAKDLDKVIFADGNPFHGNVEDSLSLFEEIIEVIGVCEQSNPPIIHRDINPKNVLVLTDGSIRLIDFGICQILDDTIITLADENVGARNYTAPECEFGDDSAVGVHSDLYSAGKVLWSAITSKRAFAREEPVFANQSMESVFPEKEDTWHLMKVFEKTIRRQPLDRWQDTQKALQDIGEIRYLTRRGFPPIKEAWKRCSNCGGKSISNFSNPQIVLTNHNPATISVLTCESCGFIFARNHYVWNNNVDRMQGLS